MKILVLNWRDMEHPEAGGAEVYLAELFGRLVYRGHSVTLLTTRFPGCQERAEQRGIEVLRRGNKFIFNWQAPFLVRKILKEKDYDCVIDDVNKLPFLTPLWFPKVRCGSLFMHFLGHTLFGMVNPVMALYVYIMERMFPFFYGKRLCCTLSNSSLDELVAKGFPKSGLTIVEPGIDVDRFCPDAGIAREEDLLLCVGRLKKYKRVDYVLEAMSALEKKGRRLRLAVIGAGDDLPRLTKRVAELGYGDRVEFLGFVDEDKKIEYLRRCAIYVNPSEKEGWGITNVEASACGTPVIANDGPGLRESVANNETGLLYRENDVSSLAGSLERLLDDGELRKSFGERGRAFALRYSWDAKSKELEEWLWKIADCEK